MDVGHAGTLEDALREAITMEDRGRCHYQALASATTDLAMRRLFQDLAVAEDEHRKKFVEILHHQVLLETVPAGELERFDQPACSVTRSTATPLDLSAGVLEAMEMEKDSRDLYARLSAAATDLNISRFYEALSQEEHGHWLTLDRLYQDLPVGHL